MVGNSKSPKPRNSRRHSNQLTRPFRGPTPPKTFQTVDLGAGHGDHMIRQAARFPNRKYAGVDDKYGYLKGLEKSGVELTRHGVHAHGGDFASFLDRMIKRGEKTRNLLIEMPDVDYSRIRHGTLLPEDLRANMLYVIQHLNSVLIPNGKLHVVSERQEVLVIVEKWAKEWGYTARWRPVLLDPRAKGKSQVMYAFRDAPIYRLEITYNLKKVHPKYLRQKISGKNTERKK